MIDRFSEDIDLILDWKTLGFTDEEPYEERSKNKQEQFNNNLNEETEKFLQNKFLPGIESDFKQLLNFDFNFSIDILDKKTILFEYPRIFNSNYLTQSVRLEIGSLASKIPADEVEVQPLISSVYPDLFQIKAKIKTVTAERTFLEKLTILHHEAHRPITSALPARYARHYYDVFQMYNTAIKDKAIDDYELLVDVVNFKMKFYPRNWARYEEILKKNIKLVPSFDRLEELRKDYISMKEMIYGEYPSFEEILQVLEALEMMMNFTGEIHIKNEI